MQSEELESALDMLGSDIRFRYALVCYKELPPDRIAGAYWGSIYNESHIL